MTESCSGRSGAFDAVHWYRAPGRHVPLDGQPVEGYWAQRGNRIVLADSVLERGATVRHEMLHALLQTRGHPLDSFLDSCAEIVECAACGAWVPPTHDFISMPADSMGVEAQLALQPRESDGQRWLSLWVVVRNARAHAVVVTDPYRPTLSSIFGFDLRGPDGGGSQSMVANDSSTMFFAPFATKRWLFEFRVTDQLDLGRLHISPGHYIALGRYGSQVSNGDSVVVDP